MSTRGLRNEEEYEAAIYRLQKLAGSKSDTPEFEEMTELIDLIEIYESIHYPIPEATQEEIDKFLEEQKEEKIKLSCLNCRLFESFREANYDETASDEKGICHHPKNKKKNVGKGVLCEHYISAIYVKED
jgi:hypothetical protein